MSEQGAIYARISKKDKSVPKVKNQIEICLALAEEDGVTVDPQNIFVDDGIAASGKAIDDTTLEARPGAQALLKAMADGRFKKLYAVEGERLARTYMDGLQFIKTSAEAGVIWHLDTDGILNPATPAGEETAVSIFSSGRREGRVRTARQARRYKKELEAGMPLWNTRPFGYVDRIHLHKEEADLIRQATDDYLAGRKSMIQIAQDWTALGMLTDGMKKERQGKDGVKKPARPYWTATTVRAVLLRDRNAGILIANGVRQPVSQIEPIITEEQLEELKSRVKLGTPMGARAHSLLGGILKCECGAPMHSTISYTQRKGKPRREYKVYTCSQKLYDKTRKHSNINAVMVDELMTSMLLTALYKGELESPEGEDTSVALKALSGRLEAVREGIEHVGSILFDLSMKKFHAKAKAQLQELELQEEEILIERDRLLTLTGNKIGLSAFMKAWRDGSEGFNDREEFDQWTNNFWDAWNSISIHDKHAMMKSKFAPTVRCGGRGIGRVELNEKKVPALT